MFDTIKRISDPTQFNSEQSETAKNVKEKLVSGEMKINFIELSDAEEADYPPIWIVENDIIYFMNESDLTYIAIDVPEDADYTYNRYGSAREEYLKSENEELYKELCEKNRLKRHLAEIDKNADDLEDSLIEQMCESEGITAELKKKDMMEWVGRYNNLKNRVREIVLNEIIYV